MFKSRPQRFRSWKELLSFRKCACRIYLGAGWLNQHVFCCCWTCAKNKPNTTPWGYGEGLAVHGSDGKTSSYNNCRLSVSLYFLNFYTSPLSGITAGFFSSCPSLYLFFCLSQAEGYVIGSCIKHIPIAGRDITYFTQQLLREREVGIPPEQSLETAKAVKVGPQL